MPTMPLMSLTTCYKTLPSYFADKVTQHVRKRRQYHVTSSNQNDDEKDETNPCFAKGHISPISLTQDTPKSQPLTTKRSCTPLASVSDNESEDDSAPREREGDASERTTEEGRPMTFLANTVSYLLRQRASPRTAISLDNVDLWEDEESESEEPRQNPQFDVINGVAINPRATIDFSELRRSRSPVANKRNKLHDSKRAAPPPPPTSTTRAAEMESSPTMKSDNVGSRCRVFDARTKPRIRYTRQLPAALVVSKPHRAGNGVPTGSTLLRTMPHSEQPRSPNDKQTFTSPCELQMPALSGTYVFSESPTVTTIAERTEVQCTNANRGNVRCISLMQTNTPCSYIKTSQGKCSQAPNLSCGKDRGTPCTHIKSTKVQLSKPQNINTSGGQDKNRVMSAVKANELNRINSRLKSVNSARNASRDLDTDCAKNKLPENQNPTTGPDCQSSADSCTSTGSAGTSPERKVKFNNFVTVREGDMNTYGYLRESHDSAQKIKQKYLTGVVCKSRTAKTSIESEKRRVPDSPRRSPPAEIVF